MDCSPALAHRSRFFALAVFLFFAVSVISAQKNADPGIFRTMPQSGPETLTGGPIQYPADASISCADLNRSSRPELLQITQDWELRLNSPGTGTFPAAGTVYGGMPENPNLSVGLAFSGSLITSWNLNWVVPEAQDTKVSAVILSSPLSGSTVYSYPQLADTDSRSLEVGEGLATAKRVSFCFEQATSASQSAAFIAGRVTDPRGRGLSRVKLTVFDVLTNQVRIAYTNTFGYYRFMGLIAGDEYFISLNHRRYLFLLPAESFTLDSNIPDMNFQATE